MMKALVAVLVVLVFAAVAAPLASARAETEAKPEILVISDAPQGSPIFVRFFYFFNQKLIQWWRNGGRTAARGKWTISVSEFYNEDMEPRGITMIVTCSFPPRRMMMNGQPVTGVKSEAVMAAYVIATFIETAAKEDQE